MKGREVNMGGVLVVGKAGKAEHTRQLGWVSVRGDYTDGSDHSWIWMGSKDCR